MDWILLLKAVLSLIFVLGLLMIMLWSFKYMEQHNFTARIFKKVQKKKRLEIIEIQRLDTRNKLVLLRWDNSEHLLLIGPSSIVVEKNINESSNNHE